MPSLSYASASRISILTLASSQGSPGRNALSISSRFLSCKQRVTSSRSQRSSSSASGGRKPPEAARQRTSSPPSSTTPLSLMQSGSGCISIASQTVLPSPRPVGRLKYRETRATPGALACRCSAKSTGSCTTPVARSSPVNSSNCHGPRKRMTCATASPPAKIFANLSRAAHVRPKSGMPACQSR